MTSKPAPPVCSRGHVLATAQDVALLADRVACARCIDEALDEHQRAFGCSRTTLFARRREARHAGS